MPLYGRRASKPNPGTLIDWAQPLARGLAAAFAVNEGSGARLENVANPAGPAVAMGAATATDSTWVGTPYGWGLAHTSAHVGNGLGLSLPATTTTFTVAARVKLSIVTAGAYQNLITNGATAGFWSVGGKLDAFFSGADHLSTTAVSAGAWVDWAFSCVGGSGTFYLDGAADGTAAGMPSFIPNGMLCDAGATEQFSGTIDHLYLWIGRALTAADVASLHADPWQPFAPPGYRTFGATRRVRRTLYDRAGSRGVA